MERRRNLTIATIFSFSANEDDPEDAMPDEGFEPELLDKTSREFWNWQLQIITVSSIPITILRRKNSKIITRMYRQGLKIVKLIC